MAPPQTEVKKWHNEAVPCQKLSEITFYHPDREQKGTRTTTMGSS